MLLLGEPLYLAVQPGELRQLLPALPEVVDKLVGIHVVLTAGVLHRGNPVLKVGFALLIVVGSERH